jgi:hypothetical protein
VDAHVVPGEAHHAVAGQLEVGVAGGVALAIAAGAMELEAVEPDRQALVRPEGVDFVSGLLSLNCSIEGGGRYVGCGFQEGFEAPFREALLGAGLVGGDRPPKRLGTAPALGAV